MRISIAQYLRIHADAINKSVQWPNLELVDLCESQWCFDDEGALFLAGENKATHAENVEVLEILAEFRDDLHNAEHNDFILMALARMECNALALMGVPVQ